MAHVSNTTRRARILNRKTCMELSDWTPLARSVLARDTTGVATLLAAGASPNERFLDAKRKGRGFFPLEYAVYLDAGPVVEALVRGGAAVEQQFEAGGKQHTALSLAVARGKKAAAQALQPRKAEEEKKEEKKTLLTGKSPMLSQRAPPVPTPQPRQGLAKQGDGSLRSKAVSPRPSAKNAQAVVNYGELVLGEEIGKGAYGKVVKGEYMGRKVACKVMSLVKEEKEQEQLRREIQLQFAAKHPSIVEMFGLSMDPDKNLVIVMELVEGGDLLSLLKNAAEPLEWTERARMAKELASAVAFLHGRGVLHRDIKSENILVDEERRVKLCDFGFARAVETRARASTVLGTPYYAAPEVLTGRPYDAKADVFAVGVIVLEMATRRSVNIDRIAAREVRSFVLF